MVLCFSPGSSLRWEVMRHSWEDESKGINGHTRTCASSQLEWTIHCNQVLCTEVNSASDELNLSPGPAIQQPCGFQEVLGLCGLMCFPIKLEW